jgi:hypothetical protein
VAIFARSVAQCDLQGAADPAFERRYHRMFWVKIAVADRGQYAEGC